jgi:Ser/Thr protein kinase RdoA (MazF antagonist)
MIPTTSWTTFLTRRGIDVATSTVSRLVGGEVNDNWRIDGPGEGQQWVLRQYRRTGDAAEVECELGALNRLARSAFPTPAPVPVRVGGDDRRLWDWIDGRPAALFEFVRGQHPPERPGGYGSMDLDLGRRCARLAARMHATLADQQLPGRRHPDRDPWRRIGAFLDGDLTGHPLFADLVGPLRALRDRLEPLHGAPQEIPVGLIHNDIGPPNILIR